MVTRREPQQASETPQMDGERRTRLKRDILGDLSSGRWLPAKELEQVVRLIPPDERRRYAEALLARLEEAASPEQPTFWQRLFRRPRDERQNIIDSLGVLGDPTAAPALRARLTDPDLRARAIVALGRLRATDGVEPLITLMSNPRLNVNEQHFAIEALGLIGHEAAVPVLLSVVEGSYPGPLKRSAIESLGKVCQANRLQERTVDEQVVDRLSDVVRQRSDDYRYRKVAARALARSGHPRAVLSLMECLHDRSSEVRYTAARGLAWLEDTAAIPALIMASATDPDTRVREAATNAVERLQDA